MSQELTVDMIMVKNKKTDPLNNFIQDLKCTLILL